MASSEDYTITKEEAFSFLQYVLKIDSAETKLNANKVTFLEELIKVFGHHIPYQTVTSLATSQANRRLPNAADIKEDVISKKGGICYQLNVFFWMLLRGLHFEASLVPSDGCHLENTHVAIILSGVTSGSSKHLVDVGNAYPTFRLFSLDFEHLSPEYNDSFMRYRFLRQGKDIVIFQISVDSKPDEARGFEEFIEDGWFSYNFMRVNQPVDITHFDQSMTDFLTVVDDKVFFLTSLRCLAYPHGRLRCIKDSKLLIEDGDQKVQVTRFKSSDEILEAFVRYFPQFPEDMIKSAMENVQIHFNGN